MPSREALVGRFGLIPHWSKDDKISRHTYNARAETVMEKPSFRDAWQKAQDCIISAQAIYEADWRIGKAIATRIEVSRRLRYFSSDPLVVKVGFSHSEYQHPQL